MVKDSIGERFGAKAIARGFITIEQFLDAMRVQVKEEVRSRKHRTIGQILKELEYINDAQVIEVLKTMGIHSETENRNSSAL